uniref:Uncharacterized protein n=1 Tax=Ananas comosus var. bracteatus TaxID=296719 RepID=A0A6V7PF90_ANACO|nr:unnamed protein product [Ananas comosus var. bracteatus]
MATNPLAEERIIERNLIHLNKVDNVLLQKDVAFLKVEDIPKAHASMSISETQDSDWIPDTGANPYDSGDMTLPDDISPSRVMTEPDQNMTGEPSTISISTENVSNTHHMITRSKVGVIKPNPKYALSITHHTPLEPKSIQSTQA